MSPIFAVGQTVVTRFVRGNGDRTGPFHPLRVLADDGQRLLAWIPEDTEIIGTRLADGRRQHDAPIGDRFTLPRIRVRDHWRGASTLRLIDEAHWSSVWWFFDAAGRFTDWYVNLEIPRGRTESTVDRTDGALDVVVSADRRWRWDDEDEADAAVAAGIISAAELAALRAEGERVGALAEAGAFPFDGTWCDFTPDPDWPRPELPVGIDQWSVRSRRGDSSGAGSAS